MDKPTALKSPLTQRRSRLGLRRNSLAWLLDMPTARLAEIELGRRSTSEEEMRVTSALKMLEVAHADIHNVFAVSVAA